MEEAMKKLSVKDQSACMACLQCVNACSEAFYKETNPGKSCIQIIDKDGEVKTRVCVQCGKCAKACEHDAISQNAKGVYVIDKKKCKKCGKCVEACPFGLMVLDESKETPSKCIACGICAKACPMDVLEIKES